MSNTLFFDRRGIAEILGLDYSVVKGWSTGKPLKIVPSVWAPGRKGSTSLFSIEDLYKMAVAAQLMEWGLAPRAIARLLQEIKPEWLPEDVRGLLICYDVTREKPVVTHLTKPGERHAFVKALLSDKKLVWGLHLNLKGVLDRTDSRIAEMQKRGKL